MFSWNWLRRSSKIAFCLGCFKKGTVLSRCQCILSLGWDCKRALLGIHGLFFILKDFPLRSIFNQSSRKDSGVARGT
jgi:hypothetical protein